MTRRVADVSLMAPAGSGRHGSGSSSHSRADRRCKRSGEPATDKATPSSLSVPTTVAGNNAESVSMYSGKSMTDSLMSSASRAIDTCFTFNPLSRTGKFLYIGQMLVLPLIPIVVLGIQNVMSLATIVQHRYDMLAVQHGIDEGTDIGVLLTALQVERSEVAFYIFTNGSTTINYNRNQLTNINYNIADGMGGSWRNSRGSDRWRNNLSMVFDYTDVTLEKMTRWNDIKSSVDLWRFPMFSSKLKFQIRLEDMRDTINHTATEVQTKVDWYTKLNDVFLDVMARRVTARKLSSNVLSFTLAYLNMLRAMEYFNLFLTYGLRYHANGALPSNYVTKAVRCDTLFWEYLNTTRSFSREVSEKIHSTIESYQNFDAFMKARMRVMLNANRSGFDTSNETQSFYVNGTVMSGLLREVQVELRDTIIEDVQEQVALAYHQQMIAVCLMVTVLSLAPVFIYLVKQLAVTMQNFAEWASDKSLEIARERHKADRLLGQMLPETVVRQLKSSNQAPAEHFDSVTVYFSDIVGFTAISAQSSPLEIVTFLNTLYKIFDAQIDRYSVYKVETTGDAYMCVSGLPVRNGDLHAPEIAEMSLDLIQAISNFEIPHVKGRFVEIRVGLNSGSCVAGVIGTKMPRYCLFGDTINVASRMESTGLPQKIHVSESTYLLLKKTDRFDLEFRDNLEVKGKGSMATYWLKGMTGGQQRERVAIGTAEKTTASDLLTDLLKITA